MKINHYGFLTLSIQKSSEKFLAIGFEKLGEIIYDKDRGINILFLSSFHFFLDALPAPSDFCDFSPFFFISGKKPKKKPQRGRESAREARLSSKKKSETWRKKDRKRARRAKRRMTAPAV